MFRVISNRIGGRKKVTDEHLSFGKVLELIADLNRGTGINAKYSFFGDSAKFWGTTPSDIYNFLRENLGPTNPGEYCEAKHQVFLGKRGEKHYIDLKKGGILASIGGQEVRREPYAKATLEYFLRT